MLPAQSYLELRDLIAPEIQNYNNNKKSEIDLNIFKEEIIDRGADTCK